jgi:hypothetical protein
MPTPPATLDLMGEVITVQTDTREQCVARLAHLCELLDLTPTLFPTCSLGTGRWMARAAPARRRPDDGEPEPERT